MPELASPTAPAARQMGRDPASKLLGLLDFSAARSGEEAIENTLGVLLFSLMGEFAVPGAAVLLDDGKGVLNVCAAKGRVQTAFTGKQLRISCIKLDERPMVASELAPDSELATLSHEAALDLFVPIRHRGQTLGLLALGSRVTKQPWLSHEIDLVRLVGGIAGTVVANHRLLVDLKAANRSMERHLFDLHTISDVSGNLARACDPETILRAFAQPAMAHLLVTQFLILLTEGDQLQIAFTRGLTLGPGDLTAIQAAYDNRIEPNPDDSGVTGDDAQTVANLMKILSPLGVDRLVPFRASMATRGYLGIGARKDGRQRQREELEFLTTLGQHAATALDNLKFHRDRARREQLEREIGLARDIQTALFPRVLPQLPGYRLHALTEPCFEVGGDYYDAMALDDGLLLAVADVAGKGIPAALLMSTLQATIRSVGRRPGEHPSQMLQDLNRNLVESTHPGKFVTFFLASLNSASHTLTWSNAGHNWPFIVRASGAVERLKTGGTVLGIIPEAVFEEGSATLEPGDLLFVFTDGVTEAMDADDREFSEERLSDLLVSVRALPPEQVAATVLAAVRQHAHGVAAGDDLTILAISRDKEAS